MQKCKQHIPRDMPDTIRLYGGSVATIGRTYENPLAHGSIWMLQECARCGWRRQMNRNGRHEECSSWWDHPGDERRAEEARRRSAEAQRRLQEEAEHPDVSEAAEACAAAYQGRVSPTRSISFYTVAHEAGGFLALLQDTATTDEVVIGHGVTRATALRHAAANAEKIVQALGERDQPFRNLGPHP